MQSAFNVEKVRDHLANERTYLAWLRTGLSMVGLGIALAKFALYLLELIHRGEGASERLEMLENSRRLGLALIVSGIVIVFVSAIQQRRREKAINEGSFTHSSWMVWATAAFVVVLGLMGAYWVLGP